MSDLFSLLGNIGNTIANIAIPTISNTIYGALNNMAQGQTNALSAITSSFQNQINYLSSSLFGSQNNILANINAVAGGLQNNINNIQSNILGSINNLFSQAQPNTSVIQQTISTVLNALTGGLSSQIQGAQLGISSLNDKVLGLVSTLPQQLQNQINGLIGGISSTVSNAVTGAVNTLGGLTNTGLNAITNVLGNTLGSLAAKQTASFNEFKDLLGKSLQGIATSVGALISQNTPDLAPLVGGITSFANTAIGALTGTLNNQTQQIFTGIADVLKSSGLLAEKEFINRSEVISIVGREVDKAVKESGEVTTIKAAIEELKKSGQLTPQFAGILSGIGPVIMQYSNVVNKLMSGKYAGYNELLADINITGEGADLAGTLVTAVTLIPLIPILLGVLVTPAANGMRYLVNGQFKNEVLPVAELLETFIREKIDGTTLEHELNKHGFNRENIERLLENKFTLPDFATLATLFNRGEMDRNELRKELSKLGYTGDMVERLVELTNVLPQIPDIIRMAVREVFSPDIAEKFGQYEDYPQQVSFYAGLLGLDEEWAKRFWAAHWELPSPQMAFEMYQRRIIDYDTLVQLLKALDVMPFWRDKLIKLAYNPLTRVDVRRMYGLKVLTEQQIYDAYLDIGYSPENARNLTEFTKRYENQGNDDSQAHIKKLTQTSYEKAYKRGIIGDNELFEGYTGVGYQQKEAELLAAIQKYDRYVDNTPDRRQDYKERIIKLYVDGFSRGVIDEAETRQTLLDIGLPASDVELEINYAKVLKIARRKASILNEVKGGFIDGSVDEITLRDYLTKEGFSAAEIADTFDEMYSYRRIGTKKPTEAKITAFFKKEIISQQEFIGELRNLGYSEKYIGWILKDLGVQ